MSSGAGTTMASASACASTGASPHDAATSVATGQSAPQPVNRDLVMNEAERVSGGAGPPIIAAEEIGDDGTYIAEVKPAAKRQKRCTSKVWNYFTKSDETNRNDDGVLENQVWVQCNRCSYKTRGESVKGTKSFWNHLKLKHSITQDQEHSGLDEGKTDMQNYKYDPAVSLKKFYLALVMHEYPFTMTEHEFFVDFIKSLRPGFSLKCRITAKKEIMQMYSVEKKRLFELMKSIPCRFSATMDMWTSRQTKGYMCITIHWIDNNWQMQKRVISLCHVKGSHKGVKLATEFINGVMDWNMETRLFAVTLDNASNNNSCVRLVVTELNKLCRLKKCPPLICGGVFFHVRCLCHIINLVAQDGLKAIGDTVKNIRATIVIVKNSTLQWEEFQNCAEYHGLNNKSGLALDVPTRWNSTYDMLRQAIYYKTAFQRFVYRNLEKYVHCASTDDEWTMAESLCKCLQKLSDATVLFSGCQYPTANLFWWKFYEIKVALSEWCGSVDSTIAHMANAMQKKYDKYWKKSNIALAVACFLNPRYKHKLLEYFLLKIYGEKKEKAASELNRYMDVVNKLFQAYNGCGSTHETRQPNAQAQPAGAFGGLCDDNAADIEEFLYEDAPTILQKANELEVYMKQKPLRWVDPSGQGAEFDVLSWWKVNQMKYPVLSRLARDVLAVQVSTVAPESTFSHSGRIVSAYRSRLDPETVEALVCTKDRTKASKKGPMAKIASFLDEFDDEEFTAINGSEYQTTDIEEEEEEEDDDILTY